MYSQKRKLRNKTYHMHQMNIFKLCSTLTLSLIFTGTASPECTSSDLCEYPSSTWEHTKFQSVTKETLYPKSCAAACADLEWCLGVTDDEKANMCIFHLGAAEDKCTSLTSTAPDQTLHMKRKHKGDCLSVGYLYITIL